MLFSVQQIIIEVPVQQVTSGVPNVSGGVTLAQASSNNQAPEQGQNQVGEQARELRLNFRRSPSTERELGLSEEYNFFRNTEISSVPQHLSLAFRARNELLSYLGAFENQINASDASRQYWRDQINNGLIHIRNLILRYHSSVTEARLLLLGGNFRYYETTFRRLRIPLSFRNFYRRVTTWWRDHDSEFIGLEELLSINYQ